MDSKKVEKEITQIVQKELKKFKEKLRFNSCREGKIVKVNGDGTYEVGFLGKDFKTGKQKFPGDRWTCTDDEGRYITEDDVKVIPSITGMEFKEQDSVWIEAINGDENCEFIKCLIR